MGLKEMAEGMKGSLQCWVKKSWCAIKAVAVHFWEYFKWLMKSIFYCVREGREKSLKVLLRFIFTPTYLFAEHKREGLSKEKKADLFKEYNSRYMWVSILTLGFFLVMSNKYRFNEYLDDSYKVIYIVTTCILIWFLPFSRINEIFHAFIVDAIDKVSNKNSSSALTYGDRITLALRSYLELVFNFAIIYCLVSMKWFSYDISDGCVCYDMGGILDALYYSGVTITTLGYGDISPNYWITQLLSVYEVFCGFILLIVSFTIYVGKGLNENVA